MFSEDFYKKLAAILVEEMSDNGESSEAKPAVQPDDKGEAA